MKYVKRIFVQKWSVGGIKICVVASGFKVRPPVRLNGPEPHLKSSLSQWSSHRQGNSACCCWVIFRHFLKPCLLHMGESRCRFIRITWYSCEGGGEKGNRWVEKKTKNRRCMEGDRRCELVETTHAHTDQMPCNATHAKPHHTSR